MYFSDYFFPGQERNIDRKFNIGAPSQLLKVIISDGKRSIRLSISLRLLGKRLIWFFNTHRLSGLLLVFECGLEV